MGAADETIVSLACQIAKLKQWGKAWQQTANAKQAEAESARRDAVARADADRARIDDLKAKLNASEAESRVYFEQLREVNAANAAREERDARFNEVQRLKAELAVTKDDRDRLLRSATTAVGALFSDSKQRERAVMAMLPAVTERMRDGGSMVVLPDNRHIASALSLGLRQLAELDMATHDTPAGKAAAQSAAPHLKPIAIKGLIFDGKQMTVQRKQMGEEVAIVIHDSDTSGESFTWESFVYLTQDGAREMAAALTKLAGGAA